MSLLSITLKSLLYLVHHTSILHPIGSTTLVIIRLYFILLSILVISSLTNPGSCDQYTIILMFSINDFCECMNGIFSLVTTDDISHYSGILYKILYPIVFSDPCFFREQKKGRIIWNSHFNLSTKIVDYIFSIYILNVNILPVYHYPLAGDILAVFLLRFSHFNSIYSSPYTSLYSIRIQTVTNEDIVRKIGTVFKNRIRPNSDNISTSV